MSEHFYIFNKRYHFCIFPKCANIYRTTCLFCIINWCVFHFLFHSVLLFFAHIIPLLLFYSCGYKSCITITA